MVWLWCGKQKDSVLKSERDTDFESLHQSTSEFKLSEKIVYDFVWAWFEDISRIAQLPSFDRSEWDAFAEKNFTKDFMFVRSSGNPLDTDAFIRSFEKGHLVDYCGNVINVENLKFVGNNEVATIIIRTHESFTYKGTENDEIATWTAMVVVDPLTLRPKMTNLQRSIGRGVDETVGS